jgi:hypothetical protein
MRNSYQQVKILHLVLNTYVSTNLFVLGPQFRTYANEMFIEMRLTMRQLNYPSSVPTVFLQNWKYSRRAGQEIRKPVQGPATHECSVEGSGV